MCDDRKLQNKSCESWVVLFFMIVSYFPAALSLCIGDVFVQE